MVGTRMARPDFAHVGSCFSIWFWRLGLCLELGVRFPVFSLFDFSLSNTTESRAAAPGCSSRRRHPTRRGAAAAAEVRVVQRESSAATRQSRCRVPSAGSCSPLPVSILQPPVGVDLAAPAGIEAPPRALHMSPNSTGDPDPGSTDKFLFICPAVMIRMDQDAKDPRPSRSPSEPNLFLQWGSRKRLRCVKTRDDGSPSPSPSEVLRRAVPRATRPLLGADIAPFRSPRRPSTLHRRKSDSLVNEYKHSIALSPEKDRYYSTRGSPFPFEGNGFDFSGGTEEKGTTALPRFFIALSNKEKEEDFMAMKGCKLPQRPKKRPKMMQKCLLMVSPGAWLSDLSHERYEVREKKSSKKRARGLKALSMESDSE